MIVNAESSQSNPTPPLPIPPEADPDRFKTIPIKFILKEAVVVRFRDLNKIFEKENSLCIGYISAEYPFIPKKDLVHFPIWAKRNDLKIDAFHIGHHQPIASFSIYDISIGAGTFQLDSDPGILSFRKKIDLRSIRGGSMDWINYTTGGTFRKEAIVTGQTKLDTTMVYPPEFLGLDYTAYQASYVSEMSAISIIPKLILENKIDGKSLNFDI